MKVALHHGSDIRIVDVEKETPKFYIVRGEKFKKVESPTPDCIAEGYGSGTFKRYILSEVDSDIIKTKIQKERDRHNTGNLVSAIAKKFQTSAWVESNNHFMTHEQAKHLNEYLNLGLELKE